MLFYIWLVLVRWGISPALAPAVAGCGEVAEVTCIIRSFCF